MKTFPLLLLLFSLCFFSCEKETAHKPAIPLKEAVMGNWQVTYQKLKPTNFTFEDQHEGVVTEWGCYYILSIKIKSDGTYVVNDSDEAVTALGEVIPLGGHWTMDEQNQMIFSCGNGTNTSFRASMGKDGRLVLENDKLLLRHNKKD